MGIGKSAYEKRGVRCFYRLSPIESKMIKTVWQDIDVNLQYHGHGFITKFCEKYPQYLIYFTSKPRYPLNTDITMIATASVVLESMSYLLLNYYNKIDKFDRLIGYLAMYHKDMGLVEQDIKNFMDCLLKYLIKVNPILMTPQCQKVFKKYFYCIQDEFSSRMEEYNEYDCFYLNDKHYKKFFNNCFLCEKNVYGYPISYWQNRKRMWEERLDSWNKEIKSMKSSTPIFISNIKTISESNEELVDENVRQRKEVLSKHEITENYITGMNVEGNKIPSAYLETSTEQVNKSEKSLEMSHNKLHNMARQRRRNKLN